jgi:1-acyl-sn-glycerol-3-phosphate acyltransferase
MAFDGFDVADKEAFAGYSALTSDRFFDLVDRLALRWHVELAGAENLPAGPGILVANHAFGFWDLALAVARIRGETHRKVWCLGEHLWWKVPMLRRLAASCGVVDGTPENADALLSAGELLLVLPGGLREALKPRELRYRLLWGRRYGFVRAAMRNRAPLVPLACIGGDEVFDLVGNAFERGRRLHLGIPLPRPRHGLPIPRRMRLRVVLGEPIEVAERPGDSERVVRSLRREVEGAIHELLEEELARRARFPYGACDRGMNAASSDRQVRS